MKLHYRRRCQRRISCCVAGSAIAEDIPACADLGAFCVLLLRQLRRRPAEELLRRELRGRSALRRRDSCSALCAREEDLLRSEDTCDAGLHVPGRSLHGLLGELGEACLAAAYSVTGPAWSCSTATSASPDRKPGEACSRRRRLRGWGDVHRRGLRPLRRWRPALLPGRRLQRRRLLRGEPLHQRGPVLRRGPRDLHRRRLLGLRRRGPALLRRERNRGPWSATTASAGTAGGALRALLRGTPPAGPS
jgi:hypothetical protein